MKKLLLSSIAVLSLLCAAGAQAQSLWTFRPPPEYDKPFDGVVMVQRLSPDDLKKVCPPRMMACSVPFQTNGVRVACLLVLPPDDSIKARGLEPKEIYRHEIGHCNGWPAHHGGATWQRKTEQPTRGTPQPIPPASPEDPYQLLKRLMTEDWLL